MKGSSCLVVILLVVTSHQETIFAQEHSSSGSHQAIAGRDYERQELKDLMPELGRAAQARATVKAFASNIFDRLSNEDHTNIELDKINEAHRYDLAAPVVDDLDLNRLARLFELVLDGNARATSPQIEEVVAGQMDRKQRSPRDMDKEYRSISPPTTIYPSLVKNWRADKLRDMVNGHAYR